MMRLPEHPPPADAGPGQFVFSLDLELGWGSIENGGWRKWEACGVFAQTRAALVRLLRAMDECQLPATWGVRV